MLLLVRDQKVQSSNPVCRTYSLIAPTESTAMIQSVAWEVGAKSWCAVIFGSLGGLTDA
jgi:hypothetical protein